MRLVCKSACPIMLIPSPTDNDSCSGIFYAFGLMTVIGNATKAYLFLLRVRAVYCNSKLVTIVTGAGGVTVVCIRLIGTFLLRISVSLRLNEDS